MTFLLYGANGYTGRLIAEQSVARGFAPILAGRNDGEVRALAERLGVSARVFSLDDPTATRAALADVRCVLHAAGPFEHTSTPMARACLDAQVDYLDITGEIPVFEALAGKDAEARARGVMLLPGVGFDVVPSDCLIAHVVARAHHVSELHVGIAVRGGVSRGTANTVLEHAEDGSAVRRDGKICVEPLGKTTRTFDYGDGPSPCVAVGWGDVSTAFHSTGVPNVTIYFPMSAAVRAALPLVRLGAPLLRARSMKRFAHHVLTRGADGPNEAARTRGSTTLVVEAIAADGSLFRSRLDTPEAYACTVETALLAVARVLAGKRTPGFTTPSRALGKDAILEIAGTARVDLTP